MKFWTKDLLLCPSAGLAIFIGFESVGMLQTYSNQLTKESVLALGIVALWAMIAVVFNLILAVKLIKAQVKGK